MRSDRGGPAPSASRLDDSAGGRYQAARSAPARPRFPATALMADRRGSVERRSVDVPDMAVRVAQRRTRALHGARQHRTFIRTNIAGRACIVSTTVTDAKAGRAATPPAAMHHHLSGNGDDMPSTSARDLQDSLASTSLASTDANARTRSPGPRSWSSAPANRCSRSASDHDFRATTTCTLRLQSLRDDFDHRHPGEKGRCSTNTASCGPIGSNTSNNPLALNTRPCTFLVTDAHM